ncbi:histidine phosphatase family protein [Brachybacterium sp. FME24]|uniref:histidine phosphatase family protein n=1 Tax=Brachybacterium sp. FME24 TaxID=2742605 RepID=UPI00186839E1|nr:histidine phosphatase family protein [Brachybacterium sp. FME24]
MPIPDPHLPASQWILSSDGRSAALSMGQKLPGEVVLLSSTEQKAIETAHLAAGRAPACDAGFREVDRPGEPFDEFSSERRGAWIRGELDDRHHGWETPAQAARRFSRSVQDHPKDDVLIATHGMVLVAWLVDIGRVESGRAAESYWSALTFPQLITVEIPT